MLMHLMCSACPDVDDEVGIVTSCVVVDVLKMLDGTADDLGL